MSHFTTDTLRASSVGGGDQLDQTIDASMAAPMLPEGGA